jgi:hypothetical protein
MKALMWVWVPWIQAKITLLACAPLVTSEMSFWQICLITLGRTRGLPLVVDRDTLTADRLCHVGGGLKKVHLDNLP